MKRILFVVGTRPEIVKTAPVIQTLRRDRAFKVGVCLSGQHIRMVTQMLRDFDLDLDFDLKIMRHKQTLVSISKKLMPKLEKVYSEFRPDMVFVQGDTTTAFVASLVAFYHNIEVAHIEAGLRTFDKYFPFPEEMNRTLIGRIADRHYAPTPKARENLLAEGVKPSNIRVTGNTGIDSLKFILSGDHGYADGALNKLPNDREIVLITAHRRENFGKRFDNILAAIKRLAKSRPDVEFIYPVHPNPHVKEPAFAKLGGIGNVKLLPSLDYSDLVRVMSRARFILTDSGGIQEEAPYLGKPVLILRDKTERPEAVKAGAAMVVGTDTGRICDLAGRLLTDTPLYKKMAVKRNVFGDGKAAQRIMEDLKKRKV